MREINIRRINTIVAAITAMNYGTNVTHSDLAAIMGVTPGSKEYLYLMPRAKKELLKRGKCLKSIFGVGYTILTPDEYVEYCLKYIKRGFNAVQSGVDTLQYAPVNSMSNDCRTLHQHMVQRARYVYAAIAGGSVELRTLGMRNPALLPEPAVTR